MLRTILVFGLNLGLPFVLYALYKKMRPPLPPLAQWPWLRLLSAGIILLGISLPVIRWLQFPARPDPWHQANPAADQTFPR